MLGSNILEIVIGIILIFLIVSIICTAIREGIESILNTRAAYLEHGIRQLLSDPQGNDLARYFYEHPRIFSMYNGDYKPGANKQEPGVFAKGNKLPAYITAKNFALTLMDIAANGAPDQQKGTTPQYNKLSDPVSFKTAVSQIPNPMIRSVLLNAVDTADGDMKKVRANLEEWFNNSMDRVSAWYKKSTQVILFLIAIVVVVVMNLNCIKIADYLAQNDAARTLVVESAGRITAEGVDSISYDEAKKELATLSLPMGWENGKEDFYLQPDGPKTPWNTFFGPILGMLIIIFATMLGAPFWFDLLNKFMVLRSTVKPNEKSPPEDSEDRSTTLAPQPVMYAAPGAAYATAPHPAHEDDVDGCNVETTTYTEDKDLPETKGGVEK